MPSIKFATFAVLAVAAIWDLRAARVPNLITIPAICLGLGLNAYLLGWGAFKDAVLGAALGTILLLVPFALGGIGAGDVKLMAAVGALNGSCFVFHSFLYSAVAGGLLALIVASVRGRLRSVVGGLYTGSIVSGGFSSGLTIPYAVAILVGTTAAYLLR